MDSPRKLFSVSPFRSGQIFRAMMMTAREASQVWMLYQAMAPRARIRAGRLAPKGPKEIRASTGYGTPVFCPA